MSEPENFLSRWSRRKREAAEAVADAADETHHGAARPEPVRPSESGNPAPQSVASRSERAAAEKGEPAEPTEPEFDLSKLPSIDSITAETDIRPFLAPGVPSALAQAALRRAWIADPKIRDFIGVAENQWDFTAPGGVPGFDLSRPTGEITRVVSDMLRSRPKESVPEPDIVSEGKDLETGAPSATSEPVSTSHRIVNEPAADGERQEFAAEQRRTPQPMIAQREEDVAAPQNNSAQQNDDGRARRRTHGRAIPR
jgi:hypothetical protein